MALFNIKRNQKEDGSETEKETNVAPDNKGKDIPEDIKKIKTSLLEKLNKKLNGHIYDDCIIMPKGFTIDVSVGRREVKDGIFLLQFVFIVKNDEFDEPLIDPVDSQGKTEDEAIDMAAQIFHASVWHPIDQSMQKKNPIPVSVNYLMQHYDFDMYAQSIVRIGVSEEKKPVMLMNYIKAQIPKYLGSKKYYWIRIYLAKLKEREITEVRVNGSVCSELSRMLKPYVDGWDASDKFMCEKQYAIFVQREDDQCPFKKEEVVNAAKSAIDMMVKISNRDEYKEMAEKLDEITGSKAMAAEIRIFVPEILAKMTLGYAEGDSLFLLKDDSSIEFRKTQLRSYFYIQQVVIEYLSTRPPKEDVQRIVFNSVAFREMQKTISENKANGREIKPSDLFVPGTSYRIGVEDYKVW